jgi:hypothetical protein
MIAAAELNEWFTYHPNTGEILWRKKPERSSIQIGSVAGSIHSGRRMLRVQGRRIYAARAAYIMTYGSIPQRALIDHIDGDTLNNRVSNLRLANSAQNTWNRIQRSSNPSLKLGVSKDVRGRFKARIQVPNGDKFNLGTWDTEAEAHAAYMGAAAVLHGEYWVGRRGSSDV